MSTLTRIMKLPLHDNVLVGRDLDQIFDPGKVYAIREFGGSLLLLASVKVHYQLTGLILNVVDILTNTVRLVKLCRIVVI